MTGSGDDGVERDTHALGIGKTNFAGDTGAAGAKSIVGHKD